MYGYDLNGKEPDNFIKDDYTEKKTPSVGSQVDKTSTVASQAIQNQVNEIEKGGAPASSLAEVIKANKEKRDRLEQSASVKKHFEGDQRMEFVDPILTDDERSLLEKTMTLNKDPKERLSAIDGLLRDNKSRREGSSQKVVDALVQIAADVIDPSYGYNATAEAGFRLQAILRLGLGASDSNSIQINDTEKEQIKQVLISIVKDKDVAKKHRDRAFDLLLPLNPEFDAELLSLKRTKEILKIIDDSSFSDQSFYRLLEKTGFDSFDELTDFIDGDPNLRDSFYRCISPLKYEPKISSSVLNSLTKKIEPAHEYMISEEEQNEFEQKLDEEIINLFARRRGGGSSLSEVMERTELFRKWKILKNFDQTTYENKSSHLKEAYCQWMKLLVGHEWGGDLSLDSVELFETTGHYQDITRFYASILATKFMDKTKVSLSLEGQKKVSRSLIAADKALHQSDEMKLKSDYSWNSAAGLNKETGEALLRELNENGIVSISAGWSGHCVGLTIHKAKDGNSYLYYCNRGGRPFEQTEDRKLMGGQKGSYHMTCFKIGKEINPELLGKLAATVTTDESEKARVGSFIEGGEAGSLFVELGLTGPVALISKSAQKIGNCAWANTKGTIQASMIAAAFDDLYHPEHPIGFKDLISDAIKEGTAIFKALERDGREESLDELIQYDALKGKGLSPFDHLQVMTAIARKLQRKIKSKNNSQQSIDRRMYQRVLDFFKDCKYPLETIRMKLEEGDLENEKRIENAMLFSEGAFAIVNDECWTLVESNDEYLHKNKCDMKMTLGELVRATPKIGVQSTEEYDETSPKLSSEQRKGSDNPPLKSAAAIAAEAYGGLIFPIIVASSATRTLS